MLDSYENKLFLNELTKLKCEYKACKDDELKQSIITDIELIKAALKEAKDKIN
ncbi:hypothetical protein [Peribacillus alkalitolerans]|uniref:hypothetical protein n=1 Tax=Peribacillus alkalitolerans TaxID=1550385 RepID=UPI0013D2028C|nr:hypothetical protein [Peribacillus alkalitolerans]